MRVPRFRFTLRQLMILVVIVALPLAFAAYRYAAGRKAALAEAKAHLAQARAAREAEEEHRELARKWAGSLEGAHLTRIAADHGEVAKTSEKVAGEILGRYGMKPPPSK